MGLSDNPFSVLTILVAPATLTNRNVNSHQPHGHALCARVNRFRLLQASAAERTDDGRQSAVRCSYAR
jgi:hypothetical protein